jgi:hypothetical protein
LSEEFVKMQKPVPGVWGVFPTRFNGFCLSGDEFLFIAEGMQAKVVSLPRTLRLRKASAQGAA